MFNVGRSMFDVHSARVLEPLDGELFELFFGDHGNCRFGDLRLNKQVVDFVCIRPSQRKLGSLRLNENQAPMANFCLAIYPIRPKVRLPLPTLCRELRNPFRLASELPQ